ncbi:MAG: hypothetical protein L6R39_004210 [Caloplaca ligustica]|nr:MAG: hypothetical protein L6R39_004210 [Caloplaca ligustica]
MASQGSDGSSMQANFSSGIQEVDGMNHNEALHSATSEPGRYSKPANQDPSIGDDKESPRQEASQASLITHMGSWISHNEHVRLTGSASAAGAAHNGDPLALERLLAHLGDYAQAARELYLQRRFFRRWRNIVIEKTAQRGGRF